MTIELAQTVWLGVAFYLAAGALFGGYFVFRGVQRIDGAANDAGTGFRLLLLPGAALLWPVLIVLMVMAPRVSRRARA